VDATATTVEERKQVVALESVEDEATPV